jgi:hypothetical protein
MIHQIILKDNFNRDIGILCGLVVFWPFMDYVYLLKQS